MISTNVTNLSFAATQGQFNALVSNVGGATGNVSLSGLDCCLVQLNGTLCASGGGPINYTSSAALSLGPTQQGTVSMSFGESLQKLVSNS